MILITIVTGSYKPTYNWGASHCSWYTQMLMDISIAIIAGNIQWQISIAIGIIAIGIIWFVWTHTWYHPNYSHFSCRENNPMDLEVAYFQTQPHFDETGKQWEIDQEIWRCCGIHPWKTCATGSWQMLKTSCGHFIQQRDWNKLNKIGWILGDISWRDCHLWPEISTQSSHDFSHKSVRISWGFPSVATWVLGTWVNCSDTMAPWIFNDGQQVEAHQHRQTFQDPTWKMYTLE